jgi:hypothetical protein
VFHHALPRGWQPEFCKNILKSYAVKPATGLAVDLAATGILRGMRRRSKDAQRNNERNGTPNRHVHE